MNEASAGWERAPEVPSLGVGDVHVWLASTTDVAHGPDAPATLLTADERARAARYVFARDRDRFAASRIILRTTLAAYLGIEPAAVRFDVEHAGKPVLHASHRARVDFNLSHSERAVLVAISAGGPVGADVEAIRHLEDRDALAQWTFAPGEYGRLQAIAEAERDVAFFRCWTRKEAFVKALGTGLGHPLDRFEVTGSHDTARLLHVDGDAEAANAWVMADIPPVPGCAGAVVMRPGVTVRWYRWTAEMASRPRRDERCMA